MSLGRQAKTLSKGQIEAVVGYLNSTRHPLRNRVIFYLSVKAGLRAKEIANLTWPMLADPSGIVADFIRLENWASKGRSGRIIQRGTRGLLCATSLWVSLILLS